MGYKIEPIYKKSLIISVVLTAIMWTYFESKMGGMIVPQEIIVRGIIILIIFMIYFIVTSIISYIIKKQKLYPNIFFRISLPFFTIILISLIVFGLFMFEPFTIINDFNEILTIFFKTSIPFILVTTVVTGFFLWIPVNVDSDIKRKLFRNNLLYLIGVIIIFLLSIFLFYTVNKIKQPELDKKYSSYLSLDSTISSKNYQINLLSDAENFYFDTPYLLINKNELIINVIADNDASSKNLPQFVASKKIDIEGNIKDELIDGELFSKFPEFYPIYFQDGLIRNRNSTKLVTWAFDGNKRIQEYSNLKMNNEWKIVKLLEKKESIKKVKFLKTSEFHCNDIQGVLYNGINYYNIIKDKDTLKIKIDSIYSHIDNLENCEEKKITYYDCKNMNFSLLRFNEKKYYIIKRRKK